MIGQTLSHFRITAKLGEGGMGEVYRAEDTRLGREVAIKVLPEGFTADPERLARFEREARVLASLNHPNIAGIHQVEEADGLRLLVMELVEGEDLSAVLARGRVSLEETLAIAQQIAEALESAHERGIVHRDLKPANIKVTPDGQAKVLDFGLAKALEAPGGGPDSGSLSISPTLTAAVTSAGVLLGTAPYMSPEQAKGMESDRRADVWAFGVVIWEMLTGRRLFAGDSISDTLAAVLRDEIDPGDLPGDTPPALQSLLARCLDRDPKLRLRDIGEARVALSAMTGGQETSTLVGSLVAAPAEAVVETGGRKLGWVVAALMTGLALVATVFALRPRETSRPLVHSNLVAPDGAGFDVGSGLALSPDGRHLAFTALDTEGHRALWVRSIENGKSTRLSGTEGAMYPFWSPDSRSLGFMSQGTLKRVAASGGPTQTLASIRDGRGGAWGPARTIVYAPDYRGGLWSVPAAGGEAVELTTIESERGEQAHRFPVFLPDGERLLFLSQTAEGGSHVDTSRIDALNLATGERSAVVTTNSSMAYSNTGHLLFWREGSLMVGEFDAGTGVLEGDPVPIAEGIGYTGNEFATFSISQTGALVYQSGSLYESFTSMVETNAAGEPKDRGSDSEFHQDVDVSHDGSRAVYRGGDNSTLWIRDLKRQTKTRFTFEEGDHFDPTWSPDDQWIAYATNRSGKFELYRKPASGMGAEELMFETELQLSLSDWSPDGRTLSLDVLDNSTDTDLDLGLLDLETGKLEILVQSPFYDASGAFSPDGRWLAYSSAGSGQFEVFVIPVAGRGGRFQISTAGGDHPQWGPSGTKIYYVNPLVELMAVDFTETVGGGMEIGLPEQLFNIRHQFNEISPYQVMPDGESFLTIQLEQEIRGGHLTLVQNWTEKLASE